LWTLAPVPAMYLLCTQPSTPVSSFRLLWLLFLFLFSIPLLLLLLLHSS
jgi:hypothetical protein